MLMERPAGSHVSLFTAAQQLARDGNKRLQKRAQESLRYLPVLLQGPFFLP